MLPAELITLSPPHTPCAQHWWSSDHGSAGTGKGQGGQCKSWLLLIMLVMTMSSIMCVLKCSATTAQGCIFQRIQFTEVSQKLGHLLLTWEEGFSSDSLALTVPRVSASLSQAWLQWVKSIKFMQQKILLTFRRKQEKQSTSIEQIGKNTLLLPFPWSWYFSLGTWPKHFKNSSSQAS